MNVNVILPLFCSISQYLIRQDLLGKITQDIKICDSRINQLGESDNYSQINVSIYIYILIQGRIYSIHTLAKTKSQCCNKLQNSPFKAIKALLIHSNANHREVKSSS